MISGSKWSGSGWTDRANLPVPGCRARQMVSTAADEPVGWRATVLEVSLR